MTRFSNPTKGQLDPAPRAVIVHKNLSCVQCFGQPHLPSPVARPDRGDKSIVSGIGDAQGIGFVVKGDKHLHWTKDFLLRQTMIAGHFGK